MSIIFQLFSAEDLKNFTPEQLKELRDLVRDALETSPDIRAALKERANEVVRQLLQLRGDYPLPPPLSPDPLQPFPNQLFEAQELAKLADKQRKILEWAIECERNSSPHVLEAIRKIVYPWFERQPGKPAPIPEPDAEYSPYSRNYKAMRVAEPYRNFRLEEKDWPSIPPKP